MLAIGVMTAMYLGLCFSIAEMSAALPHAGGAYSFARTSMGPWGGYITGLAENMEYVLTPAMIVVGIGGYLGSIFGVSSAWEPLWWALCYAMFVALNIWGVELTFQVSVVVTLMAMAVLAVFWIGAAPHFDLARWARPYFPPGADQVGAPAWSSCRSRCGCIWASSSFRWRPRKPHAGPRFAARHPIGIWSRWSRSRY